MATHTFTFSREQDVGYFDENNKPIFDVIEHAFFNGSINVYKLRHNNILLSEDVLYSKADILAEYEIDLIEDLAELEEECS